MKRIIGLGIALCLLSGFSPTMQEVIFSRNVYQGPGDIIQGANVWYGLRAYSLSKAGIAAANVCNSGDANCADINTLSNGNFDVATAQNAPLNCGGAGGTCTVKSLYDQTGNTSCVGPVACTLTRATISQRPTLIFNCISTRPCLAFAKASVQVLTSAANATAQVQPLSVMGAMERTGSLTTGMVAFSNGTNGPLIGFDAIVNKQECYAGTALDITASDNAWHASGCIFNAGSSQAFSDGTTASGTGGGNGTGSAAVVVGNSSGTFNLDGRFAEMGMWVGDKSAQFSTLSANIHTYYAF